MALEALRARARANEPLAPHTTFRIGGLADLFIRVERLNDLVETVQLARQAGVPIFILGNGSNVLIRDGGIRGLVIENRCDGIELEPADETRAVLRAESGVTLPLIANRLAREGWSGLEWSIGIPGTIGAAVVGNAGAHGACIADQVVQVKLLNGLGVRELPKQALQFEYRASCFKGRRDKFILSVDLELKRDDPHACIARMNEYTEHRRRTQPTEPSIGSMFKNPPGDFAGRLIEQAGLKGTRVGNAEIAQTHANFFVNRGGATAREVIELVELARARVEEKFGVRLELEIEVVGEE